MRILIVEDDKNFSIVLRQELEDAGHAVEHAVDGVEGVLRCIREPYDFVLLDIKMPKLDGINALRIIKQVRPELPAVIYSGNAGSGEMAESLRAGAIRCFVKPFSIGQLKDEIAHHFERRDRG
jgi:two-component system response regulator AtoC